MRSLTFFGPQATTAAKKKYGSSVAGTQRPTWANGKSEISRSERQMETVEDTFRRRASMAWMSLIGESSTKSADHTCSAARCAGNCWATTTWTEVLRLTHQRWRAPELENSIETCCMKNFIRRWGYVPQDETPAQ